MRVIQSGIIDRINIEVSDNRPADRVTVDNALAKIASGPNGRRILQQVADHSKYGKSVTIRITPEDSRTYCVLTAAQARARKIDESNIRKNNNAATSLAQKKQWGIKGEGTSAVVEWNANKSIESDGVDDWDVTNPQTSFLTLAHELVHAYKVLKGTSEGGTDPDREEARAMGTGRFSSNPLSENGVHDDHGIPQRRSYELRRRLAPALPADSDSE